MDNNFRLEILSNFLQEEDIVLWPQHQEQLLTMKCRLIEYLCYDKVESQYGKHYSNCVWAKNDVQSGPDTCSCFYFDKDWIQSIEIMNFYYNVKYNFLKDSIN